MFRIVQSILALALLSSALVVAQTKQKSTPSSQPTTTTPSAAQPDVIGYRECKWGASIAQVKETLRGEVIESPTTAGTEDEFVGLVGPLEVQGIKFDMKFRFTKATSGLSRVMLVGKSNSLDTSDFATMLTALTQKYGKPTLLRNSGNEIALEKSADWVFPTTSIRLKLTATNFGLNLFYVEYSPSITKANDKL